MSINTHTDKTPENKGQSVADTVSSERSNEEISLQFVDNRPAAIAQRKLNEIADKSHQAIQAAQLQAMADNYSTQHQQPIEKKENNTGLNGDLTTGIENLSGMSFDDIKMQNNTPIQLASKNVRMTWLTHLVEDIDGSLLDGKEIPPPLGQLEPNDGLVIDDAISLLSRRGPHAFENSEQYRDTEKNYRWYNVKSVRGQEAPRANAYVRDGTFVIEDTPLEMAGGKSKGIVKSDFSDQDFPQLIFIRNKKISEDFADDYYDVSGIGLENPATVCREGNTYYDSNGDRWTPKFTGVESTDTLVPTLNDIAKNYYGERCNEVAELMHDAFKKHGKFSKVYEIYTGDPETENPIMVMGARVRNHYINLLAGLVYDSSTGAEGITLETYMDTLQRQNIEKKLEIREAKQSF